MLKSGAQVPPYDVAFAVHDTGDMPMNSVEYGTSGSRNNGPFREAVVPPIFETLGCRLHYGKFHCRSGSI